MTTSANKNSVKNNQVINDFGQKIGGAHKDRAREAAERLRLADVAGLLSKPLAKVAKLPDLRGLYLSGHITAEAARRAWWLWAQIGPKPSGARGYRLQGWAERAAVLIAAVADVLAYGLPEKSQLPDDFRPFQKWELFGEEMEAANWPADEYARGTYFVGPYLWGNGGYSIHNPKSSYYKRFETVAVCVAAIREKVGGAVRAASVPKFAVYFSREAGAYYIAPAGKSGIKLAEVPGYSEGFDYIDTHSEELAAKYEELKKLPAERHDWNRPRVGADYRHGADLTPEAFAAVFPFRGVEFGNWVTQIERAACLNEAADALHDLAAVLGIIPEAVTLGGSLAWAFGSRGVGRAAAHYETARRVINLTKRKGNGCVAHEWFHALDHSIMVEEGRPLFFAVADGSRYGVGEKSPIFAAAADLKKALLSSPMYARSVKIDEFRSTPYWATVTEMAARAFEVYMLGKLEAAGVVNDYLVSVVPFEQYSRPECYPYPTREEAAGLAPLFDSFIMAAFGEGERVNGADPEAEAAQLPTPPAAVVYDPAQPVECAEFQTVEAEGVAYDEPEKSQICARLEEIRAAILSESVSYEEIAYLQEHADMIAPGDTLLLEWADVPEQPAPVAASEPMNAEEDEAPTPADGVQGAAYGEGEKSQIFDNMEESARILAHHQRMKREHPEAVILYRMGNFYESYFQDAQTVADCTGVIVRKHHAVPVAGFPFHALDTYLPRIVRAGHRVAICDDPRPTTPTDGGKGAAYGSSEKSQLPEKMSREEQDSIAAGFGLVPESHGYDGTLYMLKDAAGYPVKNDKGETLQINIDAHIDLTEGPNGNPALWQRKGYTRDRLTNWWSIRSYCTREDGLCVEDYNPTVMDNGKRFIINFQWMLSITAENLKRIIAEVLRRFYGNSQKSQNSVKPRRKSVHDIYTQYCRLRDELIKQCYPLNGIHLVRADRILEIYERYVNNVHKFMKSEEWDDKKPFIRELYMLYRRPDVATLNKSMHICELDEQEFIDENGKAHTYGRGSYGFFIPKKGWVSMPGDGALPYCNDRETLKKIMDDGGYINFDGFQFVWPVMKGRDRWQKPIQPASIARKEWLEFKVHAMKVPLGCRQYVYEFIEKSLISAPEGVEWRIRHDSIWGIELKVDGVYFTVAYAFGRGRFYFDVVDVSGHFPSGICSPISWCRHLDAALSGLRIPMSWPRPYQFYAVEYHLPFDGEPVFAG